LRGHGGPGVKEAELHQEEGKKKVVLGFEGEGAEGTLRGSHGEWPFARQESRAEVATEHGRVAQMEWKIETVVVYVEFEA